MKNQIKFIICIAAIVAACVSLPTGCSTTPAGKANQAEGVIIPSVNAAMGTWAEYVKASKATQSQVDTVKQSYNAYYTAQLGAEALILRLVNGSATNAPTAEDIAAANDAVSNAKNALLNIVTSYLK